MTGFVNLGQVRGEIAREISPAISSRLSHSSFWGEGPPRTRSVYHRGVGARALGSGLRALARRGDADGESGRTSRSEVCTSRAHRPHLEYSASPRHRGNASRVPVLGFWPRGGAERQSSLSRQERTCPRQPCGTSVPARRRRSQFSSVFPHPPPPCGALLGPAGGRPVLFCMCDCGRVRGGPAWGDQAVWVVF